MEKHALSSVFGRENEKKKSEKKPFVPSLRLKELIGMLWKYRLRHVFVAKALKK